MGLLSRSPFAPLIAHYSLASSLYLALGIIALSFPVIVVSNRTYVAPSGRESELPRTRVATWRSLLQKTQFLTARSIVGALRMPSIRHQADMKSHPISFGNSIEFNDDLPLFRFIGFDSYEVCQRIKSENFTCYGF